MDKPFKKGQHVEVLHTIARGLHRAGKLDNYLELGVRMGSCFNVVAPLVQQNAYAVDLYEPARNFIKHNNNLIWFHGYTVNFFKLNSHNLKEFFDFVFIDADHKHSSSLQDFENVLPLVKEGGIICLHDTYPPNPDFIKDHCHDCYMTAKVIRKCHRDTCEIVTLPFYYGVSVVRKASYHLTWDRNL